jgi:hypothetical protein
MQISRRFFIAVSLCFTNFSFSENESFLLKETSFKEEAYEKKSTKTVEGLSPQLCEADFVGYIMGSLLRLARENLTQLTVRWKHGLFYELETRSSSVNLKKTNGSLVEVISDKDFLSIALKEEARYVEKIASKKLSKNLAQVFQNKKTFEFQGSFKESGKIVDVYKWNIQRADFVFSYGLVVPTLNNRDMSNVYRPLIPHCSEEKIKDFKKNFKPLKLLWSTAGVPSAEQGAVVFNLLRSEIPESSKK